MNFLELVQFATRESGVVAGTLPTTVEGQTGELGKFVNWTRTAWNTIQNDRSAWKWMQAEFTANITAGTMRYTPSSFALPRLAEWPDCGVTFYQTSLGRVDEGVLPCIDWSVFKMTYDIGLPVQSRPVHFSISPVGEFCVGPTPDATHTVRGPYRKSAQTLLVNADVPELPVRFHEIIPAYANLLMAEHDEAELHIAVNMRRYRELKSDLERDQLPRVRFTAPPIA